MACARRTKKTGFTTRIERRRVSKVNAGIVVFRSLLDLFIRGEREQCIALINSVCPLDVAEYIMGRKLTADEGLIFNESVSNMPAEYQELFQTAKTWQRIASSARMVLQSNDPDDHTEFTNKLKRFMDKVEAIKK